jgi:hypothetical protein
MSQVKFNSEFKGKPIQVMGGWDPPLRHFFLTIYDLTQEEEEDILWATLDTEPTGGTQTLEPLQKQLEKMDIEPPPGFWECILKKEGSIIHVLPVTAKT